ncbi:putative signal transducing protein [Anatilimnocola floriformis]|uniref:putative signal transducing protein n=1 Tax=Anatilimnocola floriformis TaxID=2948575 RepID=UPI0020C3B27C|nr:DUF2007 domain-containing protein [Anatilimnocola floriformis]
MLGRLITIESYQNAMEARLVKQQLEDAGIRCVIADEFAVSNFWHLAGAIGGIKLQVAEEDVERADAVLDELEQRHKQAADETAEEKSSDEAAALVEPKPGTDDEEDEPPLNEREDNIERAYRAVLVGYMMIPLQLYATWVLLDVWKSDLPIRPALRRKLYWALGLHFPMLIVAVAIVLMSIRGMVHFGAFTPRLP